MARKSSSVDMQRRRSRILAMVCDVPPGRVASYGQIAELAGVPRGARQVGQALRDLPSGHDVPWFRIVTASGKLAFAPDSKAWQRQVERLAADGVTLTSGRVNMTLYRWQPDLDELLWKPSATWDD